MKPIYRLFKLRLARWRNAVLRCLLPLLFGLAGSAAWAGPPRDRLTLLVPDGAALSSWQVKVWTDSAADEGIQLAIITDSALLAMGTGAAAQIAGLIVPDSAHLRASDALVAAIKQYAYLGGNLMLVYDAGVLNGAGFYPTTGNSRFADMVGVDYVFWNNGLGAATLVGFGPVVGTKARLEALSIPPGKHLPYAAPSSPSLAISAAYVPTSQYDPGGSELMSELVKKRHKKGIEDGSEGVRAGRPVPLRDLLGLDSEDTSSLRFSGRNSGATNALAGHALDRRVRSVDYVDAVFNADGKSYTERSPGAAVPEDNALRVISGYAYGPLNYFHYVTTGTFPGTVFLSSPNHGLVAGQRSYGSGQLLFVNMPLGYFKAIGTDGAPLQGFLNLFARETVGVSTLSVQPAGIGGLIYNWHVDDGDDLNTNVKDLLALKKGANPFESGPFSIHFTAGPDVIVPGDRKGMDLVNNKKSKDLVKKLFKLKGNNNNDDDDDDDDNNSKSFHEFGSHGGWIHDYWGMFANEANSPNLTHLLAQNFDAIENVIGRPIREFSAPVGNTPLWAINWLENRGVVAMYLVGDLGSAMVRSWRAGSRVSNKLWSSPVMPLGRYATFEEFDRFGTPDSASGQWLLDLQSFAINQRTNRMFYNHPPGAQSHRNVVTTWLDRGNSMQEQNRFNWYTMAQLADFSQRRIQTTWTTTKSGSYTYFNASNPSGLSNVTWLLPKSRFSVPTITSGNGSVSADPKFWVLTASSGTLVQFRSIEP